DRVVAYLYNGVPVSREELGEYLIARCGAEKLDLLVNKRIIDRACRAANVDVTEAEINAAIADALRAVPAEKPESLRSGLKQYGVNLYEWRQDVLRPKLLMTKLVRSQVRVSPEDVAKGYESCYGPKVECQAIMWPADTDPNRARAMAEEVYAK